MNTEILHLFQKFVAGECQVDELEQVRAYLAQGHYLEEWQAVLREEAENIKGTDSNSPSDFNFNEAKLYERIRQTIDIQAEERRVVRLWPRIAAAASIILALSVGGYFLIHKKQPIQIAQNQIHDIAPGHNQATLTLSGGQKIVLTRALNGKLAQQGNVLVQVNNAKAIAYTSSGVETSNPVQYNTMSTARGEQSPYPLVLSDGTKVWLNAASSITFPTAFNGNDRKVTIKGEAYFEVAHDAAKTFRVTSDGQTVEVLGTHFDINSYNDERVIKTTLLKGKVKVTTGDNRSVVLLPGEQSILSNQKIKIVKADIDLTMAWRDGMFRFDNTPLSSIMNQVARWYDVDIVYQDEALKNKTFFAMSTRFANVSQLLQNLEQTHEVKFKINGKQIIVLNPN